MALNLRQLLIFGAAYALSTAPQAAGVQRHREASVSHVKSEAQERKDRRAARVGVRAGLDEHEDGVMSLDAHELSLLEVSSATTAEKADGDTHTDDSEEEGTGLNWFREMSLVLCVIATPICLFVSVSEWQGSVVLLVIPWLTSSNIVNILNKKVVSAFPATALLVAVQMVIAVLVMLVFKRKEITLGKWQDLIQWMIMPIFFSLMLATTMFALRETTVSTVLIFRNVLPLITLPIEKFLYNSPSGGIPFRLIGALLVTLFGVVMYGMTNVSVTRLSVVLILANCVISVMNQVFMRHLLQSKDFSIPLPTCMLVNNGCGVILMTGLAMLTGEFPRWGTVIKEADWLTWFFVVASGLCGTCIGYLGLQVQKRISATMFLILSNANKVLLILLSIFIFMDTFRRNSAIGCCIALAGSLAYGMMRLPDESLEYINKFFKFGKKKEVESYGTIPAPAAKVI